MPSRRPLKGWKEIAQYLGTSERTAQRWERELGLPVHRVRNTPGATVFASANELDIWRTSPPGRTAESMADEDTAQPPAQDDRNGSPYEAPAVRTSRRWLLIAAVVLILIAAGVVVAEVIRHAPPYAPRLFPAGSSAAARPVAPGKRRILVLRVIANGEVFTCRVMDGGEVRISERQKASVAVTPAVEGDDDHVQVAATVVGQTAAESQMTTVRTELRRATATVIDVGGQQFEVEWVGTETPGARPISGDQPSDMCAITCGTAEVEALQVQTGCGSCCGLKFAGCRP